MRMDGVDDMASASTRRYEWRVGPPVVQVVERNNAPSQDSKCARGNRHKQRSYGKQGGNELYSQRLCAPGCAASQSVGGRRVSRRRALGVMRAHTSGETFRRGSTQWAHGKAGQGVGQRTGGSVAGT
jgi:hypothetical protein